MIHLKFVTHGESSISTIMTKKPLKEILQTSKGMACCVVLSKGFYCLHLLKCDLVLTSKFPQRAPVVERPLC